MGQLTDNQYPQIIGLYLLPYLPHKSTEISRDEEARELWRKFTLNSQRGKLGLLGAVTGRAEAQVMRLATKYVLLGLSDIIRLEHPSAGLAFLGYCESISEETQNQHHQNTNYQFFSGSQLSGPDGNDFLEKSSTNNYQTYCIIDD